MAVFEQCGFTIVNPKDTDGMANADQTAPSLQEQSDLDLHSGHPDLSIWVYMIILLRSFCPKTYDHDAMYIHSIYNIYLWIIRNTIRLFLT